ncbi:hypothetical protein PRZ48_011761 [Zasmidium cellare]|uniref:Xylanolytic transcriptional activator regulatory domain-containing protein n=1 Tax=Zasmidium cellare TaxID=395010 RepID=A0ABR0E7A1_ZASCE|nr:hypothetical protein PRZ48_011761 [Zasmidium cellare]
MYFGAQGSTEQATTAYPETSGPSPLQVASLHISNAFELPSRAIQNCYIDYFFKHCFQCASLVKRSWLEQSANHTPSILLLHTVLFTGSRFASPVDLEATASQYTKVKNLFFSNHEQNPILLIVASLLLQWWNPAGPERFSMDNADFWHRIGVGIALQLGIHREKSAMKDSAYRKRLWWALVARDCHLATAHGRPRAIAMNESTVSKLTVADFPLHRACAHEVTSYVAVSLIFGDIGECYRHGKVTASRLKLVGNDLYVWVHELPRHLQLFNQEPGAGLNTYDFVSRQIHVVYFTTLILLLRAYSPDSKGAILAASFIAAIFEEFLIRDEIRYLPAIHKFFLLTAGITLAPARNKFCEESNDASVDLAIIKQALRSFAERHPSALANLHTLERMERSFGKSGPAPETPTVMDENQRMFFRTFGPGLCHQWRLFEQQAAEVATRSYDLPSHESTTLNEGGLEELADGRHASVGILDGGNTQTVPTDFFEGGAGAGDLILPLQWYDTVESTSWILNEWPLNFLAESMTVDNDGVDG